MKRQLLLTIGLFGTLLAVHAQYDGAPMVK